MATSEPTAWDLRAHPSEETLAGYAFGELSDDEAASVASHLVVCSDGRCVLEVQTHMRVRDATRDLLDRPRVVHVLRVGEAVAIARARPLQLAAATVGRGHSDLPPMVHFVPCAWRQRLGDVLCEVWLVVRDAELFVRVLTDAQSEPSAPLRLERAGTTVGTSLVALTSEEVARLFRLPELCSGYWYRAGDLDHRLSELFAGSAGWVLRHAAGVMPLDLDALGEEGDVDALCDRAADLAGQGRWMAYVTGMLRVESRPADQPRLRALYYLDLLARDPSLAAERERHLVPVLPDLLRTPWLSEDLRAELARLQARR
ncbi:MAG: hypothetical protein IT379_42135 [Deltaproteobacteria bacterium]|nr:hypothetical protein [Deltaproteobacteria bacterium]